jgi:hypothetical protein
VVLAHYRRVVARVRELAVRGNAAGVGGVTQLEAEGIFRERKIQRIMA